MNVVAMGLTIVSAVALVLGLILLAIEFLDEKHGRTP